jgi:polysaccharide export outer membrane protein
MSNKLARKRLSVLGWLGSAAAAVMLLAMGLGCEVDSYMDPSVVGRWERTPVILPILDQLDVIDEPPSKAPGTTLVKSEDLIPEIEEYVIGPGDLITFTIFELVVPNVESVQTRRVDELGYVRLPLIGAMKVAGMKPSRLEKAVSEKLTEKNILKDATVSVIVQEGRQKTYSVIGEPQVAGTGIGTYTIPHTNFRLLEAMALARGIPGRIKTIYVIRAPTMMASLPEVLLGKDEPSINVHPSDNARSEKAVDLIDKLLSGIDTSVTQVASADGGVSVSMPANNSAEQWVHVDGKWVKIDSPQGSANMTSNPSSNEVMIDGHVRTFDPNDPVSMLADTRIIEVPYDKLLTGELKYNIVIRAGDVIRVPAPVIGNVYIGGAIQRPGTYALPGDKDLTLKQLIFAAGNLAPTAIPERVDLIRRVGDNQEATVRINLRDIFHGVEPDFYLKPNDTLNIGTNWIASPLAVIRNGFRMTYGFGFIVDRNFDDKVFGFQPNN